MLVVSRSGQGCARIVGACSVVVFLMLGGTAVQAITVEPVFSLENFVDGAAIDNPYFPLGPGFQATLYAEGVDDEGEDFTERSVLSFGGPGRVILGLQTFVQLDEAYERDLIVEKTFDYYAQDNVGNVWYMGEDVTNYEYDDEGVLVGTNDSSSWIAGENDARPGYIMVADPVVGFSYFQEIAEADEALDEAMIWATGLTLTIGGVVYEDVIAIFETTQLDPDAREFKYYAPGFGLIRADEGLDESFANPELIFERIPAIPVPAGFPLLIAGIAALAMIRRRAN